MCRPFFFNPTERKNQTMKLTKNELKENAVIED